MHNTGLMESVKSHQASPRQQQQQPPAALATQSHVLHLCASELHGLLEGHHMLRGVHATESRQPKMPHLCAYGLQGCIQGGHHAGGGQGKGRGRCCGGGQAAAGAPSPHRGHAAVQRSRQRRQVVRGGRVGQRGQALRTYSRACCVCVRMGVHVCACMHGRLASGSRPAVCSLTLSTPPGPLYASASR